MWTWRVAGREQRIEAAAEAPHVEERMSRRELYVESDNGLHQRGHSSARVVSLGKQRENSRALYIVNYGWLMVSGTISEGEGSRRKIQTNKLSLAEVPPSPAAPPKV